ncbi:MAG: hypothetical protein ACI86P_002284, partial [Flavobacteriales bacterium]
TSDELMVIGSSTSFLHEVNARVRTRNVNNMLNFIFNFLNDIAMKTTKITTKFLNIVPLMTLQVNHKLYISSTLVKQITISG